MKGFNDAKFKKFATLHEAQDFIGIRAAEERSSPSPSLSSSNRLEMPPKSTIITSRFARPTHNASQEEAGPDESEYDVVYTDGACKGNGKSGSVAGVGVWWGHGDPR